MEKEITIIGNTLRLSECELLYSFDGFDPEDWTIVKHTPQWTVMPDRISGGAPDEPHHGQIFYKTPVKGDVVLAFDARIVPPSYHDLVWFWNVRFDREPYSAGYLGCHRETARLCSLRNRPVLPDCVGPHVSDCLGIPRARTFHSGRRAACGVLFRP